MATRKSNSKAKEAKALDVAAAIAAAPALLSNKQLMSIEKRWKNDSGDNQYRRMATFLLTMTGAEIIAKTEKDRGLAVVLADTIIGAGPVAKRYKLMADTINNALLRATVAICHRKDYEGVWKEARGKPLTRKLRRKVA